MYMYVICVNIIIYFYHDNKKYFFVKNLTSRYILVCFWFYRGDEFRPKFQKIGELTGLFPNAAHLAVTATATLSSVQVLSKSLQYVNPVIIQINPDRPNLYLELNMTRSYNPLQKNLNVRTFH
jgi:hypothetical protein